MAVPIRSISETRPIKCKRMMTPNGVDRANPDQSSSRSKGTAPVYVRHKIVPNRFVVDSLKAKVPFSSFAAVGPRRTAKNEARKYDWYAMFRRPSRELEQRELEAAN
jgi:hypothetical protein